MSTNNTGKLNKVQKLIILAIILSAITGIVIGLLRQRGLDGTALLYIGIPTIIGIAFASTPTATSAVGATLKALTFMILISGPLLQEGFICMIMAAPILYIVGALAAWPFDHYRKKKQRNQDASRVNVFVLPALLLLMSTEGVTDFTTLERNNTVIRTQVIEGSLQEVKQRLGSNRTVPATDGLLAKLFPKPDTLYAEGLAVGDKHWSEVSYFKWVYWNEKRGRVQYEVVEHEARSVRFKLNFDDSYLNSYLDWGDTVVMFEPLSDRRTRVIWQVNFERKLDPAWYVQPLQRYAVGLALDTLIRSLR